MKKELEEALTSIEKIQIMLMNKRIDYHNVVPHDQQDDIKVLQETIEIIKNLIIEPDYIWKKPKD